MRWILTNSLQGTWQFMAADLVSNPAIDHTFVHDLESAFYVVFWLAVRFLPNSLDPERRSLVMTDLFSPRTFDNVGSISKLNWMARAVANTREFKVTNNPILSGLITSLAPYFQARHVTPEDNTPPADNPVFGALSTPTPTPTSTDPTPSIPVAPPEPENPYLRHLSDHEAVIRLFGQTLDPENPVLKKMNYEWPKDDHAQQQHLQTPLEVVQSSISSKRSNSYYAEKGSQKRSRV